MAPEAHIATFKVVRLCPTSGHVVVSISSARSKLQKSILVRLFVRRLQAVKTAHKGSESPLKRQYGAT